jgi:hypothetical protein
MKSGAKISRPRIIDEIGDIASLKFSSGKVQIRIHIYANLYFRIRIRILIE